MPPGCLYIIRIFHVLQAAQLTFPLFQNLRHQPGY